MMKNILLTIGLLMFGVVSMPAQAETADANTHANECNCDSLRADSNSKGLYGLCKKYSKALNKVEKYDRKADEKMGKDGKKAAKYLKKAAKYQKKADKVMAKYNKKLTLKKHDGAMAMPCSTLASDTTDPIDTADPFGIDDPFTTPFPVGTGVSACPCFNTQVCEQTKAAGDTCDLANVASVADLFPQQSCSLMDSCDNSPTSATDVCVNLTGSSGVSVNIYEGLGYGECSASVDGVRNAIVRLDLTTAQLCLEQLNQYDPDNDTYNTRSCNLAGN